MKEGLDTNLSSHLFFLSSVIFVCTYKYDLYLCNTQTTSTAMDVVSECKAGSGEKNGTRFSACLLFSANALARAITAIGDEEFGRVGLSYSHAYLLSEVISQPGITPSALSDTLYLTPSTITRLVEKLEQKQLVRRESEGKKTLILPTTAGEALQADINDAWNRVGQRYAAAIGETNVCQLTKQVFQAAKSLAGDE